MIDSERFKLLYGPYRVPKCELGDKLLCEHRDKEMTVKGMTDAPIQWPSALRGKRSPIVCGDLVRAIRTESELAVAHQWGVSRPIALIGTDRDKVVAKALGLPVKVVQYKRELLGISLLAQRWKEQQIALLGTAPDSQFARLFGKSATSVRNKREKLGIPTFDPKPWTEAETALIGTASDHEVGRKVGRVASCVHAKREQLGIPAFIPRWTPAELALLGTDSDQNIARLLNRTEIAVRLRRRKSKIPANC